MSMKKKFAALGIATILAAVSLTGCGSNKEEASNSPAASKPAATESASAPASESTDNAVKLTGDFEIQYFVGGYGDKWWKQVIADFKAANPDLNIKESAGPKINEQMKPRWIGGTPPDFVYIDGPELFNRQMVEDGQLLDLTDWISTATNADGEKIIDLMAQAPQQYDGGKIYDIPLVLNAWGIFWDKKLFADKGWEEPKDWASFLATSEKVKADGITPFIHTGKYPYYILRSLLYPAIVSANNNDINIIKDLSESKADAFGNPAVLAGLNQIVELRDKGFIDKASVQINHTDSQMLFLQHKDAFIPNGLWLPNEMSKDVPEGFDFGFIPSVTQAAGGKVIANTSTATVGIAAKAKNPEAAKAFLAFMFSKAQASQFAELSGAPSNIKGDISSSKAPNFVKDAAKFLTDSNTVVIPFFAFNQDVENAMYDATVALTISKITPEEWIERVSEVAKKVSK
ncbi:ABC transporter substrate-binding protein [Cohnella cholangitidis]|uniref:Extracellular solute-binding protein n=1 Tax=Cohnella cholangitidis TaxID=2598458 RepID=A0A7G5C373_9BACL|nr:extracellular solute-binding protein [Cohnella cholangitidis]QMV43657.1 extracellular solute-binding protein [Cohnella cholangitidis]